MPKYKFEFEYKSVELQSVFVNLTQQLYSDKTLISFGVVCVQMVDTMGWSEFGGLKWTQTIAVLPSLSYLFL